MGCVACKSGGDAKKDKSGKKRDAMEIPSSPIRGRQKRSDSLTGIAVVQREVTTVNEAMVQLYLGKNIRQVYDGLGASGRKNMKLSEHESGYLGSGNWGTVRVIVRKDDGRRFACKILRLSKHMSAHRKKELLDEILVLCKLDHPNIAKLYETYEEEGLNLYLVMELLSGGELFKRLTIDSKRGRFSEPQALHVTKQMTSAIAYLHSKNIVHRDLKLENFVYREPGGDDLVLIDFGLSVKYNREAKHQDQMHDVVGSSYYIAPEVLRKNYGIECDMWSLGVIVYMLLSGTPPFKGETEQKIMASALSGVYSMSRPVWATISTEAKDFVRKCLIKDVKKRMTSAEALHHPWFQLEFQDISDTESVNSTSSSRRLDALDGPMVRSLVDYSKNSKFKRIALQAVAYCLSHEEIKELELAFKQLDKDGDGYITFEELKEELAQHHKLTSTECQEIFNAIDFDHTGKVHFNEFIAAALNEQYYLDETVIQHAFDRLDLDHDGLIDVEEIHKLFGPQVKETSGSPHSQDHVKDVLEEILKKNEALGDSKLKGKLTVKDFMQIMRSDHEEMISTVKSFGTNPDCDDDFLDEDEADHDPINHHSPDDYENYDEAANHIHDHTNQTTLAAT